MNSSGHLDGDGGGGRRFSLQAPTGRRCRSGNNGRGRRRNGQDARRRRTQNRGRGGAGWQFGTPCLALLGRNSLLEGGGGNITIAVAAMPMARVAAQMRSLRIADVRRKETRGIETMLRKGEDNSPQDMREFGSWGSCGATMMPALEIFESL